MWESINTTGVSHYTVYYTNTCTDITIKNVTFPANTNEGVIGGLDPNLNYAFSLSVTVIIGGSLYEGDRTLWDILLLKGVRLLSINLAIYCSEEFIAYLHHYKFTI